MAAAPAKKKIKKLLVANRGEIACRIMRSCKKLGIQTVAVYSEADANALHVRTADEKYCIGPALSVQSYLNLDRYAEALKATGADAVHPGYGFLSEKHKFAQMLVDMGVTFVGPPPDAMKLMGDKKSSKQVGTKAKINIIPGFDVLVRDVDHCLELANKVGYPVMVKAVGGGGGKGMRVAWNDDEARESYYLCKQECAAAFGDDRLLVEKFIDNPRHVEIQVLADNYGDAIYLNERECSVQRRNQKVVEEAPSPFLDPATRKAMGEQAVSLAKTAGYRSAGTVEFLVDSKKNFYFLEMNTRLQVEHPVTEFTTGVDIVEEMIRIAEGEPLSIKQQDVKINGWSMETRVYAEDPYKWLPSPGRLIRYVEPPLSESVRCDTGVQEGSEIPVHYDPIIAKLIVHAKDRPAAIDLLIQSLDMFTIRGPQNNIPLLRDILNHPRFRANDMSTKFMVQEYPNGFTGVKLTEDEYFNPIATAVLLYQIQQQQGKSFNNQKLFSLHTPEENTFFLTVGDKKYTVTTSESDAGIKYHITDGTKSFEKTFDGAAWANGDQLFQGSIDGADVIMQVYSQDSQTYKLEYKGAMVTVSVKTPLQEKLSKHLPKAKSHEAGRNIMSPMAGKLVSLDVQRGDHVKEGQHIAVLEAMKMQNVLKSPRSGIVKAVHTEPGKYHKERDLLIEFYDRDEDYKPLHLIGSSPAAKLFLKDLKVTVVESASAGPVSIEEGDFKVQHEQVVLGYLASKFGVIGANPEAAAASNMLIAEALQPFNASWLPRLEDLLTKKSPYLTGSVFTPADAAVYVTLKNNSNAFDAAKFPKVALFLNTVASRPNIAK